MIWSLRVLGAIFFCGAAAATIVVNGPCDDCTGVPPDITNPPRGFPQDFAPFNTDNNVAPQWPYRSPLNGAPQGNPNPMYNSGNVAPQGNPNPGFNQANFAQQGNPNPGFNQGNFAQQGNPNPGFNPVIGAQQGNPNPVHNPGNVAQQQQGNPSLGFIQGNINQQGNPNLGFNPVIAQQGTDNDVFSKSFKSTMAIIEATKSRINAEITRMANNFASPQSHHIAIEKRGANKIVVPEGFSGVLPDGTYVHNADCVNCKIRN